MAPPTFGAVTSSSGLATGAFSLAAPAGLAAGDFQIAVVMLGSDAVTIPTTPPAGWTFLGEAVNTSANSYRFYAFSSTTATGPVSFTKSTNRAHLAVRAYWDNHGGMIPGSFSLSNLTGGGGTAAIPAKTPADPDSLVIALAIQDRNDTANGATATPPAGFTERFDQYVSAAEHLIITLADRPTTSANQAISGSFTWSATAASAMTASLVLDSGVVPIAATDSGLGTDTISAVDKTRLVNLAESGLGTDNRVVDADAGPYTDTALGSDAITIDQLVDVFAVDSGTGSDQVEVADFIGNDLVESGAGTDTAEVVRTNFVTLTDSGLGTDSNHALLRQLNTLTDAGLGKDTLSALGMPQLVDTGVGTDDVSIVVIPFTQVLLPKPVTVYDLVVVARVPQPSGPPQYIEIDPIEWKGLEYTNTLSQPQELTATCQLSSVTESVLQRMRNLADLATELWLYRAGTVVFAGPIQGWQTSGETLSLKAKGLLAYLRLMIVQADLSFKAADQFSIVKGLVDQWQALEYGHFGIDTSSVGLSGQVRDAIYLREELHNVGQRIEDLGKARGGFDVEVDPASRTLQLWSPYKGVDRSEGEDAIVIDERNITSGDVLCSVALGDLASEAFGTGTTSGADTTLFSTASNTELRARYGRTAWTQTFDTKEQAALDAFTEGLLDARGESLLVPGPNVRVTPDADLSDYTVGDTIAYELGSTLGVSGAFRIRSQKITASNTGQESVDLEFV